MKPNCTAFNGAGAPYEEFSCVYPTLGRTYLGYVDIYIYIYRLEINIVETGVENDKKKNCLTLVLFDTSVLSHVSQIPLHIFPSLSC